MASKNTCRTACRKRKQTIKETKESVKKKIMREKVSNQCLSKSVKNKATTKGRKTSKKEKRLGTRKSVRQKNQKNLLERVAKELPTTDMPRDLPLFFSMPKIRSESNKVLYLAALGLLPKSNLELHQQIDSLRCRMRMFECRRKRNTIGTQSCEEADPNDFNGSTVIITIEDDSEQDACQNSSVLNNTVGDARDLRKTNNLDSASAVADSSWESGAETVITIDDDSEEKTSQNRLVSTTTVGTTCHVNHTYKLKLRSSSLAAHNSSRKGESEDWMGFNAFMEKKMKDDDSGKAPRKYSKQEIEDCKATIATRIHQWNVFLKIDSNL